MTEREIFLGALDKEEAAARAAYLDATYVGRPALRQRVEALLRSHREADSFLNVPAMEQVAAAEAPLTFLEPSRRSWRVFWGTDASSFPGWEARPGWT
jgi:hypothetical protein